ncbi:5-oxoprolinase subunit B family protein [Cellulomonas rhizosphaerae]|uniref:Allophanate hydrolase subunit 1 n=1 Tax=Cellulomonas rhizosphaerae TaxID=2293719 RepID=A0A413RIB2_9CELL|nr:allophanate hydrolase subunit 1 [Cellulomonas rhizosphaerae]RHA37996.1 allophanate hydrolase subunit 1 [Cellulomonas rhizosphaerae]
MKVLPFGDDAVLVELDDLAQVRALDAAVRAARGEGRFAEVVDQVPAARTLLLRGVGAVDHAALATAVRALPAGPAAPVAERAAPVVELEVTYDGPDLDEVADLTGLSADEVVARHTAATYTVAFGGFMPGFAYLVGLDPLLRVPRRPSPRERVLAGSVAIADEFSAVYPAATPGGWRLIGRCERPLWDVDHEPPALLAPGTRVRFVEAG